ncbi:MAG: peptide ABC transporter substrate-binding protein [Dehalococcoidia bacterium]
MNRLVLTILGIMGALVIAVGAIVIALVATGGDDNGPSGQQPNQTPGSETSGELRLSGQEPITLDPAVTQDSASGVYVVEIFGGLLTLDPDLKVQPDLAAELPTLENGGKVVNEDGTVTYTFTIRDNATFHDQRPVRADDVKYSLERAADPATLSLVAEFFLGDIVGVKEKLRGEADEVSGVQVIDSHTIAITIEQDLPSFLYKLTYPTAFVVDQRQIEADPQNWTRTPNGTGPYMLDEWSFGERIVLKANDRYHLGAPHVQTVTYLLSSGGITLYETGDVDVAGVGLDELERVQDPADELHAQYKSGERLALDYVGFDTKSPPFDDPKAREAFVRAIDREQIASAIFKNAIPVANGIIMPGMPAYDPQVSLPAFDPAKARQLLEESKYGGPEGLPKITLAESGSGATSGEGTAAIVEMWRQNLGVEVEIQQADSATFYQDVQDGVYQMWLIGWIMDYPLEDNLLNLHFDSDSANNDTGYSNPDVDTFLRQALTEQDEQTRIQLYQQAQREILADLPWIPLFFDRFHILVKPYVHDYLIPTSIVPRLRFISLDGE